MERDFMGLNSKDSVVLVKQEAVEISQDSGFRWAPTRPHFISLKCAQDEKPYNFASDRNAPTGFGALSAVDAAHRRQSVEIQNVHTSHLPSDIKMLPFTMSNPFYKTHFGIAGQNFAASPMKEQFLGGIPVTVPRAVIPSSGSLNGTTEPGFNSKGSAAPAQLTIFYAGTVNVFDDISPEKAQAIMFLAGTGCTASNVAQPRFQVQTSAYKLAAGEGNFVNKTPNALLASGLSSPISISSHPISQSGCSPADKDEGKTSNSATISVPPVSKLEHPKILSSVGATTIMPAAVPQARKASLARFLEKRKERVMSSAPYSLSKKPVECNNADSSDVCFSATSNNVSTSPLSVEKETQS